MKYTLSVDYILQVAVGRSKTPLIYTSERWLLEHWSFFNYKNDPEVS